MKELGNQARSLARGRGWNGCRTSNWTARLQSCGRIEGETFDHLSRVSDLTLRELNCGLVKCCCRPQSNVCLASFPVLEENFLDRVCDVAQHFLFEILPLFQVLLADLFRAWGCGDPLYTFH